MLDEIDRNFLQPFVRGNYLVVLTQQLVEQRLLVGIELGLLDLRRDAVVQIGPGDTQFLTAILVDQLDGAAVLLGPLEVVT